MLKIYLDWNIFTTIQDPERIKDDKQRNTFRSLKMLLEDLIFQAVIPYSNAHLADLMKSYRQGEREKVQASLSYISTLTKDICIAQYWNEEAAKWHVRSPREFFYSMLDEAEESFDSFDGLMEILKEFGGDKVFELYRTIPHNVDVNQLTRQMPIFGSLFINSQKENSMYAMIQDTFGIFLQIQQNPAVYNELRKMFKETLKLDPNISNFSNAIEQLDQYLPKTMLNKSFTEIFEEGNKKQYTKSEGFNRLIGIYMQLDYVGYNSDKLTEKNKYSNLFNDAQHCFYAAHCDFYITNDTKT